MNKFQWHLIKIQNFSFAKIRLKLSSAKWRPLCPGGDEFIYEVSVMDKYIHPTENYGCNRLSMPQSQLNSFSKRDLRCPFSINTFHYTWDEITCTYWCHYCDVTWTPWSLKSTPKGCSFATGGRRISLTHWGRVTHICVVKMTIIGSVNGLSPGRRQAIIWTNAGILLIGPLGTNFIEILIGIQTFSFKKVHLKMSSAKWRPFCLGLNVLKMASSVESISMSCRHRAFTQRLRTAYFLGSAFVCKGRYGTLLNISMN